MSREARGTRAVRARRVLSAGVKAPVRLARDLLVGALLRVPLYAAVGGLVLFLAARLLALAVGADGVLAEVGAWSLAAVLGLVGLVSGAVAGAVDTAATGVRRFEEGVSAWLLEAPPGPGRAALPATELRDLRARYDATADSMFAATLGRVPLPGFVRGLVRRRFRHAVVEDFLDDCAARGVETVGYTDVRNWLLARGIHYLTAPARLKLRVWRVLALGIPAVLLVATLALAVLVSAFQVSTAVMVAFAALGGAVLLLGLPRAGRHASPYRWRLGIATLAACLALWPVLYLRLWPLDLGLVWILVLAATVWTLQWGVRQAFVEADRPRLLVP